MYVAEIEAQRRIEGLQKRNVVLQATGGSRKQDQITPYFDLALFGLFVLIGAAQQTLPIGQDERREVVVLSCQAHCSNLKKKTEGGRA